MTPTERIAALRREMALSLDVASAPILSAMPALLDLAALAAAAVTEWDRRPPTDRPEFFGVVNAGLRDALLRLGAA